MAPNVELSALELRKVCCAYLSKKCQAPCADAAASHNFRVLNYHLQMTGETPNGFLGCHFYLHVEILLGDNVRRKLCFFLKTAPQDNATHMDYVNDFGVFKKEISVYKQLLPKLQQINGGLAPSCYYASSNMLIFENLAAQGYRMGAGRDGLLDYKHLHCLLKTLAGLHASAFILEAREGYNIDANFPDAVVENAYPTHVPAQNMRLQHFEHACAVLLACIELMPKYAVDFQKIRACFGVQMRRIFALVKPSQRYRNCLLHADLWANNIMFQYGKYGDIPLQARLVDFQLARYAPPALDVLTVLTITTTRAFRNAHMPELLSDYYRFFCELLKREHLLPTEQLSVTEYYASIEEYRIAGLIESCLFCHLVLLPTASTQALTQSDSGFTDFFDSKRKAICLAAFQNDAIYRERMTDMLEDLIERFLLPAGLN